MSDYGLEIFNSKGGLIYSSKYKTPRVLAMGVVELDNLNWGGSVTIDFPPVSTRPQLYCEILGHEFVILSTPVYIPPDDWYPLPRWESHRQLYFPYIGPFRRNSEGNFASITFGTYRHSSWVEYNQTYPPVTGSISNKNYVIFV